MAAFAQDHLFKDMDDLPGAAPGLVVYRAQHPQQVRPRRYQGPKPSLDTPLAKLLEHSLLASKLTDQEGYVVICTRCGAYSWNEAKALLQPCRGRTRSRGMACQLSRFHRGLFPTAHPARRHWRLDPAGWATPAMVQWLADKVVPCPAGQGSEPGQVAALAAGSVQLREALLRLHGLRPDQLVG